jgi:excisionase family DNA binding protein
MASHGREWPVGNEQDDRIPRLLLKPEEAATVLGVSRSTLYELLAAGAVESVHIGKSRRVPVAALERYVERLYLEQKTLALRQSSR